MWGKKKETLLDKVRKLTKEGKEKAIKETVEELTKSIISYAKRGKNSMIEHIDENIKDEVLKLIKEKGFKVRTDDSYFTTINW